MNITELARILKISPQELRNILPQIGFNIGQKAIKVDNKTAKKIIKEWPVLITQFRKKQEMERKQKETEQQQSIQIKKISIPKFITVKNLAELSDLPVSKLLAELMKNGIFASMNEKIDFDTASIIGQDLGLEISMDTHEEKHKDEKEEKKLASILQNEKKEDLQTRAPVIVVMGHVDHGKTKLLDAIRKTNVVAGEAGGITQHIGAYQVNKNERTITFIDTPGHEAFTAMRSRGAKVADIAILVVAADDGVKPQTVEAFRIIQAAKIPFLVAINKVDKPEADINKTKQELSTQLGIQPEDWGGKIICAEVSALKEQGIEELLDIVLLLADTESQNLNANPDADAVGTVIESHVDKAAGPVATLLVQNGTLKIGDQLSYDGIHYGKARAFKNYKGENLETAGPATPVKIIGLKTAPKVGDMLEVGEGKKIKMKKVKKDDKAEIKHLIKDEEKEEAVKKLNLIIKSDVLGSAEAVEESLMKINTEDVKVKIVGKGLGNITEGDIERAESSHAQIIAFNIKIPTQLENIIREKKITVKTYNIIYDLIQYVKEEMQKLIVAEIKKIELGELQVLAIFRTENKGQVLGGKVKQGKVEKDATVDVFRGEEYIVSGKLVGLQSGKQDVFEVNKGEECGLRFEGKPLIQEGDILKASKEEKTIKKI